ncbi:hypothetical protein TNCV_4960571 [Trichonephila clavipes]|uniref:Uncharacterized protein n=1 Tax=Trichonephila clavipes TaxID=2585209 RepID=A0A8X6VCV3_TRICX|nr:hypothetical protein TNCV_4960571 [Trichonephila clavipes]
MEKKIIPCLLLGYQILLKDTRGTVKCYLRNGLAQWARPGIEPGTSRTLSENHTPRPPSLVKKKRDFRARPGFEPGPLAPKARIIPLDHRAVSYQSDPSTQKRCQEECNYNFSMDGKENNSLFTPGLSNSVEKDTRGTVKCYLRNGLAQWARPGIEPGTSRTLSENHTPRPPSLVKFFVLILLLYLDEVKRDFRARPGFEPGTSRTQSENHTPRPPSRVVSV